MSLLLCRQEHVKRPYFMELMGVHLYSSQELSYVIFNHPMLVLDDFVDERLLTFLREELDKGFLALKLERWLKSGENPDEALMIILQDCDYYSMAEVGRFRQMAAALRKKHPADFMRMKADELFSLRQYGRAVEIYQKLLEYPQSEQVDDLFFGRVYNNLGSCYARMFQLDKAFEAYGNAYQKNQQDAVLERLYDLSRIDERLVLSKDLQEEITDKKKELWEQKLKMAREKARQSKQVKELEALFQQDTVKRQTGEANQLYQWKTEYRNMA
ncbi:MAG: hypothetical protein HFG59_07770 [Lachnospiraceae bacterium]|nr:hypothetical protein [Lachnospiraceae bacterium]